MSTGHFPQPSRSRGSLDDELLADSTAPPSLEQAQESYRYWSERRSSLPMHRRSERKEAEEMAARWKERLKAAERERYGPGPVEQMLELLGIRWRPDARRMVGWLIGLIVLGLVLLTALAVAVVAFWPEIEPIIRTVIETGAAGDD